MIDGERLYTLVAVVIVAIIGFWVGGLAGKPTEPDTTVELVCRINVEADRGWINKSCRFSDVAFHPLENGVFAYATCPGDQMVGLACQWEDSPLLDAGDTLLRAAAEKGL